MGLEDPSRYEKYRTTSEWVLGHPDLGQGLANFFNHFIQGNFGEGTQRALMLQTVTPLNKGTKGKLRPLDCAATFCRVAHGALVRAKAANLAKVFGLTQYAVGRKAALESLSRDTQAAIKTKCNAAVAQFHCSSAFNHADRTMILSHIRHLSAHLARSFCNILRAPRTIWFGRKTVAQCWSPRTMVSPRVCPASPAAFSFLILLVEEFFWSELVARAGEEAKAATDLFAYLDDLALVTGVRFLEDAIRAMESALAKARLIVNEMKGTVWTSTGTRQNGARAGAHMGYC